MLARVAVAEGTTADRARTAPSRWPLGELGAAKPLDRPWVKAVAGVVAIAVRAEAVVDTWGAVPVAGLQAQQEAAQAVDRHGCHPFVEASRRCCQGSAQGRGR